MTTTIVRDNIAAAGINIHPIGGFLYYQLPVPPGYWLPNSDCVANREPCETWNTACRNAPWCSLTSGSASNDWTPTPCKPPLVVQPCDWKTQACADQTDECLLGKKIFFVPFRPIEDTFPYPCAAGYLG